MHNELTEKQIKTRWSDIRKQIKDRPLLAYIVQIPIDKWDAYMHSTPNIDEVNLIYADIKSDRKAKTKRIREALSLIVGYKRLKNIVANGVSDTTIRDIIEGKKEMAGYNVIDQLELFLSVTIPEFQVSIENPLSIRSFVRDQMTDAAIEINSIADNLHRESSQLINLTVPMFNP